MWVTFNFTQDPFAMVKTFFNRWTELAYWGRLTVVASFDRCGCINICLLYISVVCLYFTIVGGANIPSEKK
jgi:hypothetical protein